MQMLKVLAVAATGLGLTWAANQLTDDGSGAAGGNAAGGDKVSSSAPQAGKPAGAGTRIDELSEAEMAAELKRIEQAAAGNDSELEEFTPSKPLAADLAIALPSDI